jgi:hypothetical protein
MDMDKDDLIAEFQGALYPVEKMVEIHLPTNVTEVCFWAACLFHDPC